jgi:hypothetical protein
VSAIDTLDIVASDPAAWLEAFGKVRDISGRPIRVKLNVLQRRINAVHMAAVEKGNPCRGIVVKPRKKGCSTMVGAIHYRQLCSNPHEGVIIGNKADTSDIVFRMMNYFREHDDFQKMRPTPAKATTETIKWEHRAMLSQETANNAAGGRGGTPQFLHLTEVAHWQTGEKVTAEDVLVSLLNSVPDDGFNEVWEESTPYGATGAFAGTYARARWPSADECPGGDEYWGMWESLLPQQEYDPLDQGNFVRVFAAWYEFEDSRMRLSEEQKQHVRETLDAHSSYRGEQQLIDLYANEGPRGQRLGREVTECDVWEQLAWRRMVIKTKCGGNPRKFDEEYPRDPKSCFQASGNPVFDDDSLTHVQMMTRAPVAHGQLQMQQGAARPVWMPSSAEAATFWRWEVPKQGCAYLISADLAEGSDQTKGKDPDRHSILVLRRAYVDTVAQHRLRVVARVRPPNRMPMYALVELTWLLHLYYGRALVIPEMNNSGMSFITGARAKGIPIWQRKEIDPHSGKERGYDGWRTMDTAEYGGLRTAIIDRLHEILREEAIDVHCPNIHAELVDFVDKGGRKEAGSGHDDDVLSLAIGVYNIDSATVYAEPVMERQVPAEIQAMIEQESAQGGGLAMRF